MAKQTIEIEVPEGKKAVWDEKHGRIEFVHVNHMEDIKTFEDAYHYLESRDMCGDLLYEYGRAKAGSYSEKLCQYRIIVAALTNNEEHELTTGDYYLPVIQFCEIGKEKNCWGTKKIGTIKHNGKKYTVVSGSAHDGSYAGLGNFHSSLHASNSWANVGFRAVSSREVAEYVSEQFGRLLFEVHFGGTNCDWEWID